MKAVKKKKRRNNLRYYLNDKRQVNRWIRIFREWRKNKNQWSKFKTEK